MRYLEASPVCCAPPAALGSKDSQRWPAAKLLPFGRARAPCSGPQRFPAHQAGTPRHTPCKPLAADSGVVGGGRCSAPRVKRRSKGPPPVACTGTPCDAGYLAPAGEAPKRGALTGRPTRREAHNAAYALDRIYCEGYNLEYDMES